MITFAALHSMIEMLATDDRGRELTEALADLDDIPLCALAICWPSGLRTAHPTARAAICAAGQTRRIWRGMGADQWPKSVQRSAHDYADPTASAQRTYNRAHPRKD